jgi:GNAT superfamily N-acetyltransferase
VTGPQESALEDLLRRRLGDRQADQILRAFDLFESVTPGEPHYYLSLLGTDPAHAGHGHGQRLLSHNLTLIDAEGASAYLECADDLVGFYAKFGFRQINSIVLPDGPRSNGMWRAAGQSDSRCSPF